MASRRYTAPPDPLAALPDHLCAERGYTDCGVCDWCRADRPGPGRCEAIVAHRAARKRWCTENGVSLLELMILEHDARFGGAK